MILRRVWATAALKLIEKVNDLSVSMGGAAALKANEEVSEAVNDKVNDSSARMIG